MNLNKIMIVIDPTSESQPAFERALDSSRLTGAALHLYLCLERDSPAAPEETDPPPQGSELQALATRAMDAGVRVDVEFEQADNWREAAVAAAARCGASMVFKNSADHSPVQRELRATSDWTLLRLAPCPVLLVKNFHDWQHRRVLAAINPDSPDAAHIKLNHQIINAARSFADTYGSEAHFVVAFRDLNSPPELEEITRTCGAQPEQVHLRHARAAEAIRDVAGELDVDLIIVGTVGRDGIKGRVVGNTSERLLDQTHSDLLVLN